VTNGTDPFRIAWYTTDTFYSIQMLGQGLVDAAITYSEVAEQIAIDQGQAVDPSYYLWRDHFLLVGPTTNPANLSQEDDIAAQFTDLLVAAQNTSNTTPTRFLTRYDKSATNAKESQQWINIGQTPWSTAYSTWYHQYIGFPIQALTAAIRLGEYTLTDRGTLLTLDPELTEQIDTFKAATDDLCDPLLNPAHMLVGAQAQDPELATAFAEWAIGPNGQEVIRTFERQGEALYTVAPSQEEVEAFEENGCNDAGVSATARRLRRRKLAKA
jgi:ABC-type tungstate transport system permease subunit